MRATARPRLALNSIRPDGDGLPKLLDGLLVAPLVVQRVTKQEGRIEQPPFPTQG
jgi:hypothetical protein